MNTIAIKVGDIVTYPTTRGTGRACIVESFRTITETGRVVANLVTVDAVTPSGSRASLAMSLDRLQLVRTAVER